MRHEHKAIIETLQPYHAGKGGSFEHLAWLSNNDKHRLLHTAASTGARFVPHFLKARAGYALNHSTFGYDGLLEGDTEIGRVWVVPACEELQVDMQLEPAFGIAFGETGSPVYGIAADGLLKVFKELVGRCIDLFDRPGMSGVPPWP
jgi:hypothetical protein